MHKRSFAAPAIMWLAMLLSGCGGGGSSPAPEQPNTALQEAKASRQEDADAAGSATEGAMRVQSSSYYSSRLIHVGVEGAGRVTSDRGGIDCDASGGPKCSTGFSALTYVRLTAKPATGANFTGWSGACRGTHLVCRVSNSRTRDVEANFSQAPATVTRHSLNVSVAGSGGVASNPGGIDCGGTSRACTASFAAGTNVTLTAQAPSGYAFSGWSGACSGTSGTCQVTMSGARGVNASFVPVQPARYLLDVAVSGEGSVRSSPSGIDCGSSAATCSASFDAGTSVTLATAANPGQVFKGWSGACAGTSGSCTVAMTAAGSVEASFVAASSGAEGSAGMSAACSQVYASSGLTLKSGFVTDPIPSVPKPVKASAFADPAYKTCVVRVTDHAAEPPSGFARNDYSRRQAFNADSSKLIVYAYDGAWHLYDARTFAHLRRLNGPAADAEPQWHPTQPNLLYYLPTNGGMVVHELNVSTNTSRVVGNFSGRLPWPNAARLWTKSEGSPSADGRYWAFMAETSSFSPVGIVVWDLVNDTIVSTLANGSRPDHLSMSPSGNHVVVSWLDKVVAFDRKLQNPRTIQKSSEHSDIALDENGEDVYVSVDYQSNGGAVFMVNLRTGQRTDLFGTYLSGTATAIHFSGKAFRRPGWVLMSTYADYGGAMQWLHRKITAVQLKANPTVYHLAHTHVKENGYWTEPQASVNRDFTRILFTSNWGVDSSMDVDAYMIEIPAGVLK